MFRDYRLSKERLCRNCVTGRRVGKDKLQSRNSYQRDTIYVFKVSLKLEIEKTRTLN